MGGWRRPTRPDDALEIRDPKLLQDWSLSPGGFLRLFLRPLCSLVFSYLHAWDGAGFRRLRCDSMGRLSVLTYIGVSEEGVEHEGVATDAWVTTTIGINTRTIIVRAYTNDLRLQWDMGAVGPWHGDFRIPAGTGLVLDVMAAFFRVKNHAPGLNAVYLIQCLG